MPDERLSYEQKNRGRKLGARVWSDMLDMFGAKWSRQMGGEPSETWVRVLARVSNQDSISVFFLMREDKREWPPCLADYLILLDRVRARRHGLPDAESALAAARAGDWSIPAVFEAASRLGCGRVRGSTHHPPDESRGFDGEWQKMWRAVVDDVVAGRAGDFASPPPVLAPPERVRTTAAHRTAARAGINKLRLKLGLAAVEGTNAEYRG